MKKLAILCIGLCLCTAFNANSQNQQKALKGFLYTTTNGEGMNQVIKLDRLSDGSLTNETVYSTNSKGGANKAAGGDAKGDFDAQNAIQIIDGYLLNVNAGVTVSHNSHLYLQTNETRNVVIHYSRNTDGTLNEVERVQTNGKGTNGFKATTGETSAPDPLLSANSVILSEDHQMLFVANSGDNSISVFKVAKNGNLTLMDNKGSGENSNLSSLSYNSDSRVLYAMHSFGPNHISLLKVADDMKLQNMNQKYTVNTKTASDRIPTQIIISPDNKFVLVDVLFNARPVGGENGPILTPSNANTKDGVVVFPVSENGTLGTAIINDSGTPTPFSLSFLHGSNNLFVNTFAAGNGAGLSRLEKNGQITNLMSTTVSLDAAPNGPSETCWVSIDADNKYAYAANFGFGTISSFEILEGGLRLKKDKMAKIEGAAGFKALAGIPTSGPADNWMSDDNYFYQIYGAAGILVAFKAKEGLLTEVGRYKIPLNSPQGISGY